MIELTNPGAAMYGIGAYGTGLLMVHFGWPYWASAPCGVLIAMASPRLAEVRLAEMRSAFP